MMWLGIGILGLLALFCGCLLDYAANSLKVAEKPLADKIDAVLPQQQCGKCTYSGCYPYAKAIAQGETDINLCMPGGGATILTLANLLNKSVKPSNSEKMPEPVKMLAVIDESSCIGCTLCIKACPVDAILGAAKVMHTIIASECTGCELCIAPCPVDCIHMVQIPQTVFTRQYPYPQTVQLV